MPAPAGKTDGGDEVWRGIGGEAHDRQPAGGMSNGDHARRIHFGACGKVFSGAAPGRYRLPGWARRNRSSDRSRDPQRASSRIPEAPANHNDGGPTTSGKFLRFE